MKSAERLMLLASLLVAATALTAPAAIAGPEPKLTVRIAPATPTTRTPITIVLKAPKTKPGVTWYSAYLAIGDQDPGLQCTWALPTTSLRATRRGLFAVTLKPRQGKPRYPRWCPGTAHLEIRRKGGPGEISADVLWRRDFKVSQIKGDAPIPLSFVPVKTTLLPGSTLTAMMPDVPVRPTGPAHPERVTPLRGTLRARIPGRFAPNADINTIDFSGAITPASFAPDPLCVGTTPPPTFTIVPKSTMSLAVNGDVTWNLVLRGAPSQLFGCGPAGPLTGTTSIPLSGRSEANGLLDLTLIGSVPDIALPDGSKGQLTAHLDVSVDLSGRP